MRVAGVAEAAGAGDVEVKVPKEISAVLAKMPAMLAGKMTPGRATMLHKRAPDHPYLARQLSGFWILDKSARGLPEQFTD